MMRRRAQSGLALVVVLWLLVLITVLVGTFTVMARTETLQARFLFDTTRARYAAEAGLHRAVFELRNPDLETRWVADGRSYQFELDGVAVEVSVRDETGKIDLNAAQADLLTNLFVSKGLEQEPAAELADAIQDWRDPDEIPRLYGAEIDEYERAGYPYGPKDGPFDTVSELQQVIGMTWSLYREVESAVTVHSGRGQVNPAFAPMEVLMAMPDMDAQSAEAFIAERETVHPSDGTQLMLPDGTPVSARGGGLTYTIRSRATLDSGTWSAVEATVRLGTDSLGRPFRIVRWQETDE